MKRFGLKEFYKVESQINQIDHKYEILKRSKINKLKNIDQYNYVQKHIKSYKKTDDLSVIPPKLYPFFKDMLIVKRDVLIEFGSLHPHDQVFTDHRIYLINKILEKIE